MPTNLSHSLHAPRRHSPEQVDALFARQRLQDATGVQIHLALALGACFFAGWSTTFTEWAAGPVLICFLVRMTGQHSILEPLAFDRVLRLLLAWGAWVGLSVLWSQGRRDGSHAWLNDVQSLRFLPMALILWPVMDRRNWLIVALLAGIACGQFSQIIHLAAIISHSTWQPYHRMPGRVSGWWDPVVGGDVLCAGLGLWLGAAIFASAAGARWVGTIGSLATLGCIALTGTRGAWIGAALLLLIAGGIGLWRVRPRGRVLWPWAISMLAAGMIASAGGYLLLQSKDAANRPDIAARLHQGIEEVRGAFGPDGYRSDTGLRIAMWRWGLGAFRTHPLLGVGAGGFQPWVQSQTSETAAALDVPAGAIPHVHSHAHSWFIHTGATLGIIGIVLLVALTSCAIVGGFLHRPLSAARGAAAALTANQQRAPWWHDAFLAGPALGLIGLACAGLFDSITINQQTAYIFYLLVALCLPSRPREDA